MREFVDQLRGLFMSLIPQYLGTAHSARGDKIKNDGTPQGNLDLSTLQNLSSFIAEHFPGDRVIGEEDERSKEAMEMLLARGDECQWTVDGLDGTGNRGMRTNSYGAMISRRYGEKILFAAIFRPVDEVLYRNGFFCAEHEQGAWQWCGEHNTFHPLHTASPGELERLVVLLEGGSKKFFKPPIADLGQVITTRPSLSTSIATTTVIQRRASALITVENMPWDNWPAWLMIKEAGGTVTGWNGEEPTPQNCGNMIAAANPEDHEAILNILLTKKESR